MNILITGGSTGLGAEIVKELASNPENNLFFTYSKSNEKANKISESGENIQAIHCDFKDDVSVTAFLSEINRIQPDVLINNAVIGYEKQYFHKTDAAVFYNSFLHNIIPAIKITQAFLLLARKRKFGKIINIISSANINKPPIGWSEYVANKAYLLSLSKSWATENIKFNITSNCISPAFMQTALTADTDDRIVEQMIEVHPFKKLLSTKEVAEAVAFFTTCSQQINGTNLIINAGNDLQ